MRKNRSERGGFLFHWKWHKQYSCWERVAGKIKSFSVQQFYKNAAEVWASSPHLRSKLFLQQVVPAAIAFFKTVQFEQS